MGTQIGLQHTPTIFVMGNGGAATPAVEVEDRTKIDQIIEDMLQKAPAAPPAKKPAQKSNSQKGRKEITGLRNQHLMPLREQTPSFQRAFSIAQSWQAYHAAALTLPNSDTNSS